jgi:hypothetical protein
VSTPTNFRDDYDPPERDDPRETFYAQASEDEAIEQARSEGWRRG